MKIAEFIKSIDGLSANTKKSYEQTLWQLHSVIKSDEPTKEEIYSFLASYGANSLHRHKAAIKAYLEFTRPDDKWPFTHRQFAPRRDEILRYIPPPKVDEMVAAAENEDDRMFIITLFTLGCRITELMGIEEKNVTEAGVQVLAKGGKYRLKLITKDFYPVIKNYAKGKKGPIFPRSYNHYYLTMKRLGQKIGYPDVSPHMLRHARAVDLLNKGLPLAFVQQFLGHANINTTARYLLVTGGELGAALEKVEANGVEK
jgi:site-specific recombinase XerD